MDALCVYTLLKRTSFGYSEDTKRHSDVFGPDTAHVLLRSNHADFAAQTNVSVYATAMDAARYGIKVTLVDDW